jgi:hypothetical protein
MRTNLKFSDIDSNSELKKQIDGELEEDKLSKEADLYNQILYTVVPTPHDISLGIFPDDQDISHSSVILWNNVRLIPTSIVDSDYKVVKVKLTQSDILNKLKNIGNGMYSLKSISNEMPLEESDSFEFKEKE